MKTPEKPDFEFEAVSYVNEWELDNWGDVKGKKLVDRSFRAGLKCATSQIEELTTLNKTLSESYSKLQVRFGESETKNNDLTKEVEKLREFKKYVHDRLDKMGIPSDPEPESNASHGCRIEGRLNVVDRYREAFDGIEADILANEHDWCRNPQAMFNKFKSALKEEEAQTGWWDKTKESDFEKFKEGE